MDKHMETLIDLGTDLIKLLRVRRGQGLDELFGSKGSQSLHDCMSNLRVARGQADPGKFSAVLQRDFLQFLNLIGRPHGACKDAEESLRNMREILSKVSNICQSGVFGRDAFDICAKIQSITTWLRATENSLTQIANLPKP